MKALDWLIIAIVLVGFGWAGQGDYDYRKHQSDIELNRIHKLAI